MGRILQVLGVIFIILIVGGGVLLVLAGKQYNEAKTACVEATKEKLTRIMSSGKKDKNGRIVISDPNLASVSEFKADIESFYVNCMKRAKVSQNP